MRSSQSNVFLAAIGFILVVLFGLMAWNIPMHQGHLDHFGRHILNFDTAYFPAKAFFTSLFNSSGFRAVQLVSAFFLAAAITLILSLFAKRKNAGFLLISALLLLLSQVNFLWLATAQLPISVTAFAIALILRITQSDAESKSWISIVCFSLAFILLMLTSAFWPGFILLSLVNRKKPWKAIFIALGISVALSLVLVPDFFHQWSRYFAAQMTETFYFQGASMLGSELSKFYLWRKFFHYFNPVLWFVPLVGLWLHRDSEIKKSETGIWLGLAIAGAFFSFYLPAFGGIGGDQLLPIIIPLLFIFLVYIDHILYKLSTKKIGIAILLMISICGIRGLGLIATFSPFAYLEGAAPWSSLRSEIIENEGDYLNFSGLEILESTLESDAKQQILAANFSSDHTSKGIVLFDEKDRSDYDYGSFTRRHLPMNQRSTTSYPPFSAVSSVKYKDVTLAVGYRPDEVVRKGFELFNGDNGYRMASVHFAKLKDSLPKNAEVWYGYSFAEFMIHDWEKSQNGLRTLSTLSPGYPPMEILKGRVLEKKNQLLRARKLWKANFTSRSSAKVHWLLGNSYYRQDSLSKARVHFEESEKTNQIWSKRARKSLELLDSLSSQPGFNGGVAKYFINKINAIPPEDTLDFKRLNPLMDRIRKYIDLDSTNAELIAHLGIAYLMKADYGRASLTFEESLNQNPNYLQIRHLLAQARINWGAQKFAEDSLLSADFHFKYALDYKPDDESAKRFLSATYQRRSQEYMEQNDLDNAFKMARMAIYVNNESAMNFVQMGRVKMELNERDSAEIAFNHAYLLDKTNEEALLELIDFYTVEKDMYKVKIYNDMYKRARVSAKKKAKRNE